METPVLLSACRTPVGKFGGKLVRRSATQLGAIAIQAAVERAGVTGEDVDEVIMGAVIAAGMGQAPARQAALQAGLPPRAGALTINKVCGSGLKSIMLAAQAVRCGDADVVVAGGMESMSNAPFLLSRHARPLGDRTLIDSMLHDGLVCAISGDPMGVIAERTALDDRITRKEQDEYALESHRRAVASTERGDFDAELVPISLKSSETMRSDEGPRADSSIERLGSLAPAFDPAGSVTAGNASMISDGAAAVVVASERYARSRGLSPLCRIAAAATADAKPEHLFTAPVDAVRRAAAKFGASVGDFDLFEINEAFAAQSIACNRRLGLSHDKVNVCGGAIALGHPIGASGARVVATLVHSLVRTQKQLGIASLCLGGGDAVAVVFDRQHAE